MSLHTPRLALWTIGLGWLLLAACTDEMASVAPEREWVDPVYDPPASLIWQRPINADTSHFESTIDPIVTDDRILYVGKSFDPLIAGEAVHCMDHDGESIWTWDNYSESLRSNRVDAWGMAQQTLVIRAGTNYYGIDLTTGDTRWQQSWPDAEGDLIAFEDAVYQTYRHYDAQVPGAAIFAIDPLTGIQTRVVGQHPPPLCSVVYSPPALERGSDGVVRMYYVASSCVAETEGYVRYYAYNFSTGQNDFRITGDIPLAHQPHPPLIGEQQVLMRLSTRWDARDKRTGEPSWTWRFPGGAYDLMARAVLVDSTLFAIRRYNGYALNARTGEAYWSNEQGEYGNLGARIHPPYYLGLGPEIYPFDPRTGSHGFYLAPFNQPVGPAMEEAAFRYGATIDPLRARLYLSDGYYLMALDLTR